MNKKDYLKELKKTAVALGLMASGAAALSGCKQNEVSNTTEVTTEFQTEEARDEIKQDEIDLIIEMYNAPLNEEDKITREELGIMLIESKTPFMTEKDGKYYYDYTKYSNDLLSDGETFSVDSKDIYGGYVLVDNTKNETIYGIAKVDSEMVLVEVDKIATFEGVEYHKGKYISDKYLQPNASLYEVFRQYYNERVNGDNQNYIPRN